MALAATGYLTCGVLLYQVVLQFKFFYKEKISVIKPYSGTDASRSHAELMQL